MRKNIIIFPAEVTGPFFQNEIDYIKTEFNIIAILTYREDIRIAQEILAKHGISKEKLYIIPHVKSALLKCKINPFKIMGWLLRKEVLHEIFHECLKGCKRLERLMHVFLYGGYALLTERILCDVEIPRNNLYLYSFWMGPAAYTISYLKHSERYKQSKLICRAHGGDLYVERNEMNYLAFRSYINENMDGIYFISKQGKEYFSHKFPTPNNKYIAYLGSSNKNNVLKNITSKNSITIASCSNIIDIKRLDLIISAISKIRNHKIIWIHLGSGPNTELIMQLAREKLNKGDVEYKFLGYIPNTEIFSIYSKYDVDFLINLSDSEGLPVSIMEALSMGIPVIARNVGGISEIVNNGNGLLLDSMWNDHLYEEINDFVDIRVNNLNLYRKISSNCYLDWEQKFNAEKNYNMFFSEI